MGKDDANRIAGDEDPEREKEDQRVGIVPVCER
jgi:hypothetical protein